MLSLRGPRRNLESKFKKGTLPNWEEPSPQGGSCRIASCFPSLYVTSLKGQMKKSLFSSRGPHRKQESQVTKVALPNSLLLFSIAHQRLPSATEIFVLLQHHVGPTCKSAGGSNVWRIFLSKISLLAFVSSTSCR